MCALQCNHQSNYDERRVCFHLLDEAEKETGKNLECLDYFQIYTGKGLQYNLVCKTCYESKDSIEASLREFCTNCFTQIVGDVSPAAAKGEAEIKERKTNLYFDHRVVKLEQLLFNDIVDIQPINILPDCIWLALTKSRELISINFDNQSFQLHLTINEEEIDFTKDINLHISPNGQFLVIANKHGANAILVDIEDRRVVKRFQRSSHYLQHMIFPMAFFEFEGQQLLVHVGESSMRLDISDAKTGKLITERVSPTWKEGSITPPEHYLDYFHSSLSVSPNNKWIADNGWVWHPFGMLRTWNLHQWLKENVWESEDGTSLKIVCSRNYYWDGPICWLEASELAVWGYGDDDLTLIPAVLIFNVETGEMQNWFPGPFGKLYYDKYLFSSSKERGMSVWDIKTGERLLKNEFFHVINYHQGSKQFLSLSSKNEFMLSKLNG